MIIVAKIQPPSEEKEDYLSRAIRNIVKNSLSKDIFPISQFVVYQSDIDAEIKDEDIHDIVMTIERNIVRHIGTNSSVKSIARYSGDIIAALQKQIQKDLKDGKRVGSVNINNLKVTPLFLTFSYILREVNPNECEENPYYIPYREHTSRQIELSADLITDIKSRKIDKTLLREIVEDILSFREHVILDKNIKFSDGARLVEIGIDEYLEEYLSPADKDILLLRGVKQRGTDKWEIEARAKREKELPSAPRIAMSDEDDEEDAIQEYDRSILSLLASAKKSIKKGFWL